MVITCLVALFALSGCKEEPKSKVLDANAMVTINVTDGKSTRTVNPDLPDNPKHLSPRDLVEQAWEMVSDFDGIKDARLWLAGKIEEGDYLAVHGGRKAGEYQYKLIDEAKFIFWGDFVINVDDPNNPKLVDHFFTSKNVRFEDKEGNIIGYIPQRVFRESWVKVVEAFEAKDYERVYKLFQETYTAFPCTPEEYAKLKEEGKN